MTVAELIESLKNLPQDAIVVTSDGDCYYCEVNGLTLKPSAFDYTYEQEHKEKQAVII